MDARVGGTYKMSFINFSTGNGHSFGGEYRELVPNERLRYTDKFDDPNLPGEMETTVVLRAVSCGTELSITQTGIPEVIPAEMCYLGLAGVAGATRDAGRAGDSRLSRRKRAWGPQRPMRRS